MAIATRPVSLGGLVLLHPGGVGLEIPPHTLVVVVGVHFRGALGLAWCPRSLLHFSAGVHTAAPTYVIAVPANPCCGGIDAQKHMELAVVGQGNHGFSVASAVFLPVDASVFVEVLPAFGGSTLAFLTHPFVPLLSFVCWLVAFEVLAVDSVSGRSDRWQC